MSPGCVSPSACGLWPLGHPGGIHTPWHLGREKPTATGPACDFISNGIQFLFFFFNREP